MKKTRQELEEKKALPVEGFVGLLIAVIAIFLIIPLFTSNYYAQVAMQSCFILMLLSTVYLLSGQWLTGILAIVFAIPFLILDTLSISQNSLFLMAIAYSFYCVFLAIAIFCISRKVINAPVVDTNLIFGALSIFMLAGILWSKLYFLNDAFFPNSFHGVSSLNLHQDGVETGYRNQFDLLYYSFTTLSTLGVGDITPTHHLAKSLTMMEAIFGQLFVATVVAKVVTVWRN